MPSLPSRAVLATAAAVACVAPAPAQQVVKPPVAQYWMDVATHAMAGMPDLAGMPGMPPFPGGGQAAGGNQYGNARGMAPGRWLDLALYTREKPSGSAASHAIPAGMQMGASLPLVPLARTAGRRMPDEGPEPPRERPAGRLLVYWGCGEAVRAGQPRVIDLASGDAQAYARAFGGRYAPDRGARVAPGHSLWPNEQHREPVPRGASLVGGHSVSGEGVPASLKFTIDAGHDFMPAIQLATRGALAGSIAVQWQPVPRARAYYLHAMGSAGDDMVLWSSAEMPDTGMGLFDYLPNATIERWVGDKALLPASATHCAVPRGIFASARDAGAMLRMIAWGGEVNFAHPPRPADPRTPWQPEWAVRVRVKTTAMAMLGVDTEAAAPGQPAPGEPAQGAAPDAPAALPSIPGVPEAGRAIDALKGIFGR